MRTVTITIDRLLNLDPEMQKLSDHLQGGLKSDREKFLKDEIERRLIASLHDHEIVVLENPQSLIASYPSNLSQPVVKPRLYNMRLWSWLRVPRVCIRLYRSFVGFFSKIKI